MKRKPIPNESIGSDQIEIAQTTGNEPNDNELDERLRVNGILDAQASLLRHLCKQIAESWREKHSDPHHSMPNSSSSDLSGQEEHLRNP